jgi:serine/threonine-protein kinase RsbW
MQFDDPEPASVELPARENGSDPHAQNARLRGRRRSRTVEAAELADLAIPLGAQAPSAARRLIEDCLVDRVASSVLETAQLLVSELVTNSVLHSGAAEGDDVIVRVHLWQDVCRLEVEDSGSGGPITALPPDPRRRSGLGLQLVQMLSERWGVVRGTDGPTRVWAQLSCARLSSG